MSLPHVIMNRLKLAFAVLAMLACAGCAIWAEWAKEPCVYCGGGPGGGER